jgi:hypothetical protein
LRIREVLPPLWHVARSGCEYTKPKLWIQRPTKMEETVSSEISVESGGSSAYYDPSWRLMVKQYRQRLRYPQPPSSLCPFRLRSLFVIICSLIFIYIYFIYFWGHRWRQLLTLPHAILGLSYFCIFLFYLYIFYGLISQFGHYADPIRDLGTSHPPLIHSFSSFLFLAFFRRS